MVSICTYLVAVHIEEGNMDRERAFVVTEKKGREAKREREGGCKSERFVGS